MISQNSDLIFRVLDEIFLGNVYGLDVKKRESEVSNLRKQTNAETILRKKSNKIKHIHIKNKNREKEKCINIIICLTLYVIIYICFLYPV